MTWFGIIKLGIVLTMIVSQMSFGIIQMPSFKITLCFADVYWRSLNTSPRLPMALTRTLTLPVYIEKRMQEKKKKRKEKEKRFRSESSSALTKQRRLCNIPAIKSERPLNRAIIEKWTVVGSDGGGGGGSNSGCRRRTPSSVSRSWNNGKKGVASPVDASPPPLPMTTEPIARQSSWPVGCCCSSGA
ncbi:hypothetical protein V1478_007822, partial [Vespula squamosa]